MASYLSVLALLVGLSMVIAGGGYGYGAKSYQHYGHYHYSKTTCADHYKPGIKNGYYKVYSVYHMGSMRVYCDFESEPGMAYTMVMSSSDAGRDGALVITDIAGATSSPFTGVPLTAPETTTIKHHVNAHIPNNFAYRQARSDMVRISKASKVWRMTCGLGDNTFINYIRAKVSVINPVTMTPTDGTPDCKEAEYVNMNAKSCAHCGVNIQQTVAMMLHVADSASCTTSDFAMGDELTTAGCTGAGNHAAFWFGKPVH